MERKKVHSSNLRAIGYDRQLAILEIEFRETGKVYQYENVPVHTYERLMMAMSKGRYFNEHIRDQFRSQRVD